MCGDLEPASLAEVRSLLQLWCYSYRLQKTRFGIVGIAAAIGLDRVPTFTVTVSLIEDDGSESAITRTGHCTPLSRNDDSAHTYVNSLRVYTALIN